MKLPGMAVLGLLALSSTFSTAAMAKDIALTACTKDGQTATLHVDVEGSVSSIRPSGVGGEAALVKTPLETVAREAFAKTAHSLSADDLNIHGYMAFRTNVRDAVAGKTLSDDATLTLEGPLVLDKSPLCVLAQ